MKAPSQQPRRPVPETQPPANRIVSVIVPCRNEIGYVDRFLESVLAQRLPGNVRIEVLIADGASDDGTRERLRRYAGEYAFIRILDNPKRFVAAGLNAAIRQALGDVIVRMDVHTLYAPDYIFECLRALDATGADNVGGPWVPAGSGYVSEAIALAFSSVVVSGGGKAHRAFYEGPVDTVYLGCWPRQTFEKYGLFDEDFVRTQDSELNLRIHRGGGTIWQTPAIRCWYTPRPSLKQLARQYAQYGYWKARVLKKHTLPASSRQLAPGALLGGLFLFALLAPFAEWAKYALQGLALSYAMAVVAGSLVLCGGSGSWRFLPLMPAVVVVYHCGFGYGFLRGFVDSLLWPQQTSGTFSSLTRSSPPLASIPVKVRGQAAGDGGSSV